MGIPETFCRTSGSDVTSFHLSKQGLTEPALFSSPSFLGTVLKGQNDIPLIYYSSLTPCLVNVLFSALIILKSFVWFLWAGLITWEVWPIFWSPLLGLERRLFWVFSLTWIFFLYFHKDFNLFLFCSFLQIQTLSH